MADTVIIGAGPAGLTCAYELSKLGRRAVLLEADSTLGGLSRTVEYGGYRFDIGGHRFYSKVPLINQVWDELLGADLLTRQRLSRIHYRDRFFDYPLKPLNALRGLGSAEAVRIALSYAKARVAPAHPEVNFEQWVSNQFGSRLYEIFFKTYTEKVWGIPCHEISADWADQRIKNLSLVEALRHALLRRSRGSDGEVVTTLIEQFLYPRLGPGMMWERCAERLAAFGTPTLAQRRVERIHHRAGRVCAVSVRDADGSLTQIEAEHLVSTMPVRELIQALDPVAPAEVVRAAGGLRYRDYLTVVLIVKRANVFPDNWIYVHSPEVRLGRIQNYKNWSPEMVPDPAYTSLGLEYFLWEEDAEWAWSDDQLIAAGSRDCQQIGILDGSEVVDGTVVRMRKAYPVYDQVYQQHLTTIRHYLAGISNLQLIGRNGQHRYNNQDHSMLTGIYAARNLMGGDYDVWSVNTEKDYHEGGIVERRVPTRVVSPEPAAPPEELIAVALAPLDALALGVAFGSVAALVVWLATAALLLKGGATVGPTLALLGNYLPGFAVSWGGALRGTAAAGLAGFGLGYVLARLRNSILWAYAWRLRRQAVGDDLQGQV